MFLLRKTILLLFIYSFSCNDITIEKQLPMGWSKFDLDLPDGIDVYQGQNFKLPLRAWVVKVDLKNKKIFAKVLSSNDRDRKETPLQFLENTGALVVINGGFFNSDNFISKHVGLLKTNGFLEEPASHSVIRDSERYYITRGAFGIDFDGYPDIAWCSTKNDSIFEWKRPTSNRPGSPSKKLKFTVANLWNVRDAIHAGPVLIDQEKINITVEDEVFFNTPISGVQPRSAIGFTDENELILMVVDGRQSDSRGVYLEELALLMSQFNCIEALNLDGGGSSALVADSRLLNRPLGRTSQREVMSAVGIFYTK